MQTSLLAGLESLLSVYTGKFTVYLQQWTNSFFLIFFLWYKLQLILSISSLYRFKKYCIFQEVCITGCCMVNDTTLPISPSTSHDLVTCLINHSHLCLTLPGFQVPGFQCFGQAFVVAVLSPTVCMFHASHSESRLMVLVSTILLVLSTIKYLHSHLSPLPVLAML